MFARLSRASLGTVLVLLMQMGPVVAEASISDQPAQPGSSSVQFQSGEGDAVEEPRLGALEEQQSALEPGQDGKDAALEVDTETPATPSASKQKPQANPPASSSDSSEAPINQLRWPSAMSNRSVAVTISPDGGTNLGGTDVTMTGPAPGFKQVSSAYAAGFGLGLNGKIYAWGLDIFGKLGQGRTTLGYAPTPVEVVQGQLPVGVTYTYVEASTTGTVYAIGDNGKVYSWGNGAYGALGNGVGGAQCSGIPGAVVPGNEGFGNTSVVKVAAGRLATFALKADGKVYAWGTNGDTGKLGNGKYDLAGPGQQIAVELLPVKVRLPDSARIVDVAAGYDHTLALDENGNVYAWGLGSLGALGQGAGLDFKPVPVQVPIPGNAKIVQIAAGYGSSVALDDQGNIYRWGVNHLGASQVHDVNHTGGVFQADLSPVIIDRGQIPGGAQIVQLSIGGDNFAALDSEGRVYAWGGNALGQVGNGTQTPVDAPVLIQMPGGVKVRQIDVGTSSDPDGLYRAPVLALGVDGRLYGWGPNNCPPGYTGQCQQVGSGSSASTITSPVLGVHFGGPTGDGTPGVKFGNNSATNVTSSIAGDTATLNMVSPAGPVGQVDVVATWSVAAGNSAGSTTYSWPPVKYEYRDAPPPPPPDPSAQVVLHPAAIVCVEGQDTCSGSWSLTLYGGDVALKGGEITFKASDRLTITELKQGSTALTGSNAQTSGGFTTRSYQLPELQVLEQRSLTLTGTVNRADVASNSGTVLGLQAWATFTGLHRLAPEWKPALAAFDPGSPNAFGRWFGNVGCNGSTGTDGQCDQAWASVPGKAAVVGTATLSMTPAPAQCGASEELDSCALSWNATLSSGNVGLTEGKLRVRVSTAVESVVLKRGGVVVPHMTRTPVGAAVYEYTYAVGNLSSSQSVAYGIEGNVARSLLGEVVGAQAWADFTEAKRGVPATWGTSHLPSYNTADRFAYGKGLWDTSCLGAANQQCDQVYASIPAAKGMEPVAASASIQIISYPLDCTKASQTGKCRATWSGMVNATAPVTNGRLSVRLPNDADNLNVKRFGDDLTGISASTQNGLTTRTYNFGALPANQLAVIMLSFDVPQVPSPTGTGSILRNQTWITFDGLNRTEPVWFPDNYPEFDSANPNAHGRWLNNPTCGGPSVGDGQCDQVFATIPGVYGETPPLPLTGGMGTWLFLVWGGSALGVGLLALTVRTLHQNRSIRNLGR